MALLRREGKHLIILVGFSLCVGALFLSLIAFSTPYWVQSWPRVHSGFKRIGMWEACFAGLVLERDPEQIAYHGCWWILASYFGPIKDWVMPPWFVATQVFVTLTLVAEIINIIAMIVLMMSVRGELDVRYGKKRVSIIEVQIITILTVAAAVVKVIVSLMFCMSFYHDRSWMPRPDLNYLSWSYGLYVVSAFFSFFASIAVLKYNHIIRGEYREPPMVQSPPMHMMKDSAL